MTSQEVVTAPDETQSPAANEPMVEPVAEADPRPEAILELGYDAAHAEGANLDKLREGTELTLKLMADTMAKFGVEAIAPEGQPFNPDFHQAMTMVPRDDLAPNTVASVVQKGYLLNGRLVRPAMVIVSRKP